MRTFFKFSAVGLMVFSAAGLVALFRAPFTWRFRLMFGTVEAMAIYFGWLAIRVSKLVGLVRPVAIFPSCFVIPS